MLDFKNPCDRGHIQALHENLLAAEKDGNEEMVEIFRRFIKETERVCHVVKRNLVPQSNAAILKPPEGFRAMFDAAFPEPLEKEPQPPVRVGMSGFQRMMEASQFGGAQNISDHIHHTPKPIERVVNTPMGFSGQLGAVFRSSESPQRHTSSFTQEAFLRDGIKKMEGRILDGISKMRMLPSDDPYIISKPAKSELFGWTRKRRKEETSEKMFTMRGGIGGFVYEIVRNADGTMGLKVPDPPPKQPRPSDPIPQCIVELAYHDRERVKREKARRTTATRRIPTRRAYGLKGMIDEAFR